MLMEIRIWITGIGESLTLSIATRIGFISDYGLAELVGTMDLMTTLRKALQHIAKCWQL